MTRKFAVAFVAVALSATTALASWYDDYDAGLAAIRKGQWQAAIASMTAAIKAKGQESDKARTYGTQFINYHPYYYRGVAYLNTGQYDKAISDLEQATGIGEENVGSIESLVQRAKSKLAQASTPEPQPQPQPAIPAPQPQRPVPAPQPAAPAISPAMRQQATAAISEAETARVSAQNRKATSSPQFGQALQALADARQRQASAKSDDDLNAAIASAGNAKMFFDSAQGAAVASVPTPTPVPQPVPSKVTAATNATVGTLPQRVRRALEAYFSGDFEQATTSFQALAGEMPKNGWIYAFLGASQYSRYAFEADETFKTQAMQSFRKAKQLRFKNGELPDKYFSKRIRKAFREVSG
jgi:tetratricopeptide (TPR) repeat protein